MDHNKKGGARKKIEKKPKPTNHHCVNSVRLYLTLVDVKENKDIGKLEEEKWRSTDQEGVDKFHHYKEQYYLRKENR